MAACGRDKHDSAAVAFVAPPRCSTIRQISDNRPPASTAFLWPLPLSGAGQARRANKGTPARALGACNTPPTGANYY